MKNTNEKITAALAPTRAGIVTGTKEVLRARVEACTHKLIAHDFDARLAFPINYNSRSVKSDKATKAFVMSTVAKKDETVPRSYKPNSPEPVVIRSTEEVDEIISARAEAHADALLLSYAGKLTMKTEKFAEGREVESVEYNGSRDPWGSSNLTVFFTNGDSITLSTKIIVNCSSLGKLFHQFPTRLANEVKATPAEEDGATVKEAAKPTKPASKVRKGDRIFDGAEIVTVVKTGKGYGDDERRITFNRYGLEADPIFEQSLTAPNDHPVEIAPALVE